eukprot:TRINITY_DN18603_c0_g1_i1.p2 TRINITY_DN18603_c0_g1~~TRINITY_DN18603_c0_g1_i1.p2  ORF type:complete len:241 (+),score=73.84 TRINITY_DN18603_c0_g1_i1:100-723(+)
MPSGDAWLVCLALVIAADVLLLATLPPNRGAREAEDRALLARALGKARDQLRQRRAELHRELEEAKSRYEEMKRRAAEAARLAGGGGATEGGAQGELPCLAVGNLEAVPAPPFEGLYRPTGQMHHQRPVWRRDSPAAPFVIFATQRATVWMLAASEADMQRGAGLVMSGDAELPHLAGEWKYGDGKTWHAAPLRVEAAECPQQQQQV